MTSKFWLPLPMITSHSPKYTLVIYCYKNIILKCNALEQWNMLMVTYIISYSLYGSQIWRHVSSIQLSNCGLDLSEIAITGSNPSCFLAEDLHSMLLNAPFNATNTVTQDYHLSIGAAWSSSETQIDFVQENKLGRVAPEIDHSTCHNYQSQSPTLLKYRKVGC